MNICEVNGKTLIGNQSIFNDNIAMNYAYDEVSHTNYFVYRINKKRIDGTKQYAFARCFPLLSEVDLMKTPIVLAEQEGWYFTINGGTGTGLMIENSVVIDDTTPAVEGDLIPLSIDQNGNLGYLDADFIGKGQTYVNQGIVSAMCGFFPIIDNYEDFDYPDLAGTQSERWQHAQRQIIGQFANGDYMILTSEGRNFNNSVGLTMTDAQRICKTLGVKFAYNLDGGGSTQTVHGKRIVNSIYTGANGRRRGTFIVFNGTDKFKIPSIVNA